MRVEDITAREAVTSKLQRTVEIEVKTKKGTNSAIAPINKNGIYNIKSLPAEEMLVKFLEIKRHFANQTFEDMKEVDDFLHKLDVSIDFRDIGGNLAFAISSAFLKAFSRGNDMPVNEYLVKGDIQLPVPIFSVNTSEQGFNFFLYPIQQKTFSESIMKLMEISKNLNIVNDTNDAIEKKLSSITTQNSLQIGVDFSASRFWNERKYVYNQEKLNTQEQLLFVQDMASNYPVTYIEDPFHDDDFVLFSTLTHRLPTRLVAGNDLYSNNLERFKRGIELKSTNAIVLDPTKTGTITDTVKIVKEAKENKISAVMSSGIHDNIIAQIAAGMGFDCIKLGKGSSSISQMNELMKMETQGH